MNNKTEPRIIHSLQENLKFMVREVTKQIQDVQLVLNNSDAKLADKILNRDDYIDTLKNLIDSKCFFQQTPQERVTGVYLKAIDMISYNLEHIADHAVSIVKKTKFLENPHFMRQFETQDFFDEILDSLNKINPTLKQDLSVALQVCAAEQKIDDLYKKSFALILGQLESAQHQKSTHDLITALLIFGYLERIGDAFLNIGEAILSTGLGEKLKLEQFNSFRKVYTSGDEASLSFQAVGETRSGCLIDRIEQQTKENEPQEIIFKEGNLNKIAKEKENLERWETLIPGLTPKILGFNQTVSNGSLLLEFLRGRNFRDILINGQPDATREALLALTNKLKSIWNQSKKSQPVNAKFIKQLASRMDDIYKVHPGFLLNHYQIGALPVLSLEEMFSEISALEQSLDAPFTVFIHGDFNTDNIIYNWETKKIYFIDVYRSGDLDYVQDISVFLISNFRIPIFETAIRERINLAIDYFYNFSVDFAKTQDDRTFEARLTLGVIRSLLTSTRFELNKSFSNTMFLRAVYLMEKMLDYKKAWEDFHFPVETIFSSEI